MVIQQHRDRGAIRTGYRVLRIFCPLSFTFFSLLHLNSNHLHQGPSFLNQCHSIHHLVQFWKRFLLYEKSPPCHFSPYSILSIPPSLLFLLHVTCTSNLELGGSIFRSTADQKIQCKTNVIKELLIWINAKNGITKRIFPADASTPLAVCAWKGRVKGWH